MDSGTDYNGQLAKAYDAGRRSGFAVSAMALSVVAFLSLLGLEKALLAVALGTLALRGGPESRTTRRLGRTALAVSFVYVVLFIVLIVVFWDKLGNFIVSLKELS